MPDKKCAKNPKSIAFISVLMKRLCSSVFLIINIGAKGKTTVPSISNHDPKKVESIRYQLDIPCSCKDIHTSIKYEIFVIAK